jgi:hypothetical protein
MNCFWNCWKAVQSKLQVSLGQHHPFIDYFSVLLASLALYLGLPMA